MGFSYNDITSKCMGLKARLTSWQVSGSLRNFTTTVPGKYGVTDFGADFDYREIVVSCNIFPRHSFSALVSTLDDIAAWLDPVGGLKQLVLDDVPDRYFMARLNAAVECERLLRSSGSFDLTFFCPDPFGYAIEDETFSITEAGNSTVTRLIGNMESNPIYRIEGDEDNEQLIQIEDDDELDEVFAEFCAQYEDFEDADEAAELDGADED